MTKSKLNTDWVKTKKKQKGESNRTHSNIVNIFRFLLRIG